MQPCKFREKTLTFGKFRCTNPAVKLDQVTFRDCNSCVMQNSEGDVGQELKKHIRLEALNVAPGDILTLTAAVKALHKAHPNKYLVEVNTVTPEIWDHNPYVEPRGTLSDPQIITMNYTEAVNRSSTAPYHFIHGYVQDLENNLGVRIPMLESTPDVYLSKEEKAKEIVKDFSGWGGPYWVLNAGGKTDWTSKWWAPEYYQEVVNQLADEVVFVQVGKNSAKIESEEDYAELARKDKHWHIPLEGVVNMLDDIPLRDMFSVMYKAQGCLTPISFPMHLAAGVETPPNAPKNRACVVIAGGREASTWEQYTHHQYLHTCGMYSCCEQGGCWKARAQLIGDGSEGDLPEKQCVKPVQINPLLKIPQCMADIKPEDVVRKIRMYLKGYSLWT